MVNKCFILVLVLAKRKTKEKNNSYHLEHSMPSARGTQGPGICTIDALFSLGLPAEESNFYVSRKILLIFTIVYCFAVPTAFYFHHQVSCGFVIVLCERLVF